MDHDILINSIKDVKSIVRSTCFFGYEIKKIVASLGHQRSTDKSNMSMIEMRYFVR